MFMRQLKSQVVCDYNDPVAETKQGKVRGLKIDSTYIFRGIKYADAKRFHFPEEVKPWEGVKEAITYGYVSPELQTNVAHDAYYVPHYYYPQDEDCQYLNIWTQSLDKNAKKPVMLWMHGGGWSTGSSIEIYSYDGENLSVFGDVVVVSLNHRLNVLGFLDLSAYGEEYKYSANCGLADLVAALKWVKENIANFGGDPGNVTIMGQSGGGAKVCSMLQTPAADGLFHKAVMQSGGSFNNRPKNEKELALKLADKVVENLGLTKETIKEIETIHYYDLAEATKAAVAEVVGGRYMWGPQYDGDYYMGHPLEFGFREESKNVIMLNGNVWGEFNNNYVVQLAEGSKNHWDDALVRKLCEEKFGDKTDAIMEEFKKAYPEKKPVDVLFLDKRGRNACHQFTTARASVPGAAPIYNWMFNLESPWMNGVVAWHNAEEPFMFHNAEYIEPTYIPGVSEKLQDQMTGAWVAFAYTGNPNHSLIPQWPAVTPDTVNTMIFDRECRLAVNNDKELMALLPDPTGPIGLPTAKK